MSFDARHPNRPATAWVEPHALPSHFSPTAVPPEALGKVGEAFASALYPMRRQLAGLQTLPPAELGPALQALQGSVDRLEHLGLQVQQVARVLAGEGQATSERFDLAAAARQTLAEWAGATQRRGLAVDGPTDAVPVDAVPAVVEQLLDLALAHALHLQPASGARIVLNIALQGEPPHPVLSVHMPCGHPPHADDANDLAWQLFALLARATGLPPQRVVAGPTVTLKLSFPPRAELIDAPATPALPNTPIAVGRRVLLVETQDFTRLQALRLLQNAGLGVDAVVAFEQARTALLDHTPDALVIGLSALEPECAAFIDELRARQPALRVIELVDDDNAFALSLPSAGRAGRVGRRDLARTLVTAVSQELDTAPHLAA